MKSEFLKFIENQNLTTSAVAEMADVSHSVVSQWRKGKRPVPFVRGLMLHIATKGSYQAEKNHPEEFSLMSKVLSLKESDTRHHNT